MSLLSQYRRFIFNPTNNGVDREEKYAIRLLEWLIQRNIPIVTSLEEYQVGMVVQQGHVVGLKICRLPHFTLLPFSISDLRHLQVLDLHQNGLSVLPEIFHFLPALKQLYLYDNPLKRVSRSLMRLPIRPKIDI